MKSTKFLVIAASLITFLFAPLAASAQTASPAAIGAYLEFAAAQSAVKAARGNDRKLKKARRVRQEARKALMVFCQEFGIDDLQTCIAQIIPPGTLPSGKKGVIDAPQPPITEPVDIVEPQPVAPVEQIVPVEPMAPILEEVSPEIAPEEVAPLLDSAKEEASQPRKLNRPAARPAAPPPTSDADAQAPAAAPRTIQSVETESGQRITRKLQTARPSGAQIVQQAGERIILQLNNQLVISNPDAERLSVDATQNFVEQLANGRTRETIVRRNGVRIVTIRNRNGEILRRSRFDRNDNETILVYVPEERAADLLDFRDPGDELPPLRLTIPASEYVFDADGANARDLTNFLVEPPVEQVQRLYSVDEVKRSARIRDMVRRLEIGGLTFEFGAASVAPDQIGALNNVANAMLDLLEANPAETFLIEGHTDAVGSQIANLGLSDRRAETVAIILYQAFGVPPENLATQGFGERYLKVRTEAPERLNRRVTIRRITQLVSPVAWQ